MAAATAAAAVVCPRCSAATDQVDADLGVCAACRDRLRGDLTSWVMQLVGLWVLREDR
ncbi:hypothetical protein [Streptomyces tateyamensis]|uniref:hypothetical protein n=1 Tax=Streptomyces tateyamensis TaxID=565073 RepID=UPI0015E89C87|nr:hypothetical protein [Streptomyces tateyamensis]